MAGICYGVVSDNDSNAAGCRAARRRRMEIKRFELVAPSENDVDDEELPNKAVENGEDSRRSETKETSPSLNPTSENSVMARLKCGKQPRFGSASVCGRRRDMEDAVAIRPSFFGPADEVAGDLHYFAVYDGHGCSHVAMRCSERLHQLVREELGKDDEEEEEALPEWRKAMERSFYRMRRALVSRRKTELSVGASSSRRSATPSVPRRWWPY